MDITYINYGITAFFTVYSLYYVALFAASARRRKAEHPCVPEEYRSKFLVIIPAHNEEKVVRGICSDIASQGFSRGGVRALVVADNCTDATESIAREYEGESLRVMTRSSEVRGKGAALDYAVSRFGEAFRGFEPDYVVIFDADNRIPRDFFSSLAEHAEGGYPAIQCNVRTKNPDTSLIARSSYYEGLTLQRLWQEGKDRLGLCNALAGTGEAIRYDLISEMKFGNSLTDDLDLTVRLAMRGMKVKYAYCPATYDEKPNRIDVEFRRRVRWATGHFQTFFKYGGALLRRPSRVTLDAFFYLMNIASPLVIWSSVAISALFMAGAVTYAPIPVWYSAGLSLAFLPLFCGAALLEGDRGFLKNALPFYALMGLWLVVVPCGLAKAIRGGARWDRTPHSEAGVSQRGGSGGNGAHKGEGRAIFASPLAIRQKR